GYILSDRRKWKSVLVALVESKCCGTGFCCNIFNRSAFFCSEIFIGTFSCISITTLYTFQIFDLSYLLLTIYSQPKVRQKYASLITDSKILPN
ncbi:MAG: hypothetical protein WA323_08215, partial [Candidatus Nitrosopolaris sp.]